MTPLILDWHQAFQAGLLTCGGKGYYLARLLRYSFPVPNGGVVVADVYRQLMQAPTLVGLKQALTGLRAEDVMEPRVQEQLVRLQRTMTAATLPTQVCTELKRFLPQHDLADCAIAVRSSAVSQDKSRR